MTAYPGRTYRFLTETPYFPFGYGLSYSTFSNNALTLSQSVIRPCDDITVTFDVKNLGPFVADQVCQVYLKVLVGNDDIVRDQLRLVNFTKLHGVQIQKTVQVSLLISYERMTVTKGLNFHQVIEPGTYQVFVGGYLTVDIDSVSGAASYPTLLNATFVIEGNTTNVQTCQQQTNLQNMAFVEVHV
ncbi:hypothetical protein RFI_22768 [Reticulomyxa filosa]|uniref:beta-glucosidase n=1 Tax=Reticulomyxa filosa TaxID=46433 RepID=X6ML60_RETFI|nr:hypothetical protein RFI_22768 [Reticulomyxa filosa]|eukprot:ETO14599.1 hypothetical protein RFI_22768 [Reticulomyxa filosa]